MKCIVTGGVGFIGSHLVDRLIERGDEVLVIDTKLPAIHRNQQADYWPHDIRKLMAGDNVALVNPLRVYRGTVLTRPNWSLQDAEVIFHLAAVSRVVPSYEFPFTTYTTNVIGTLNIIQLAERLKAKLIYTGSSTAQQLTGAESDVTDSPYAHSKHVGEQLVWHRFRGPGVVCRLFNVYGPRNDTGSPYDSVVTVFERRHKCREPLTITGTGEQRRDYIHVHDVADCLIAAADLGKGGWLYDVGTGVDHSVNEVAAMFSDSHALKLAERPGERIRTNANTSTWDELKWRPTVALRDYVERFKAEVKIVT